MNPWHAIACAMLLASAMITGAVAAPSSTTEQCKPKSRSPDEVSQEDSGPLSIDLGDASNFILYSKSYALLIGQSKYQSTAWQNIEDTKVYVRLVKSALERHGFHVQAYYDLNGDEMRSIIDKFVTRYGNIPNSRLVFYYYGHGMSLGDEAGFKKGYIVPVDAPSPDTDEPGFLATAVDMEQFKFWANTATKAKHMYFVFDSCFSGAMFANLGSRPIPPNAYPKSIYAKSSAREFFMSGSADEAVPARSSFTPLLVRAIEGQADANGDGFVTGEEIQSYVNSQFIQAPRQQTPQWRRLSVLDQGDIGFQVLSNNGGERPSDPSGGASGAKIGEVSEVRSTADHTSPPERFPYAIRVFVPRDAPAGAKLAAPRLKCVSGPCGTAFSEVISAAKIAQDGKSAVAYFEVWDKPTTWQLTADVVIPETGAR